MAKLAKKEEKEIDVLKHVLVPEHVILNDKEKAELFTNYNIIAVQLPKILTTDPAVKAVNAKEGDILKIIRKSSVAGMSDYYRLVVKPTKV